MEARQHQDEFLPKSRDTLEHKPTMYIATSPFNRKYKKAIATLLRQYHSPVYHQHDTCCSA